MLTREHGLSGTRPAATFLLLLAVSLVLLPVISLAHRSIVGTRSEATR